MRGKRTGSILSSIIVLLISGCSAFAPSFVTTVQDHRALCLETNEAIINTLQDECATVTDFDKLAACEDLVERLKVISRQAIAIDKYVAQSLSDEELALYLRSKWRRSP